MMAASRRRAKDIERFTVVSTVLIHFLGVLVIDCIRSEKSSSYHSSIAVKHRKGALVGGQASITYNSP